MAIVMRQQSYHFAHTVFSKATIFTASKIVLIMRQTLQMGSLYFPRGYLKTQQYRGWSRQF